MKFIKTLAETIAAYPALAIGLVAASLILLADYGIPVGGQHALDIQGVLAAAIALGGALLTHTQVSPAEPPAASVIPLPPANVGSSQNISASK